MKFGILTLGCKVNSYESEAVINSLINHGFIHSDFNDICDVYIVNTCTVTMTSDQKSRQMLHQARRRNKDAILVAMGCFVQLNPIDAAKCADILIGTNNRLQTYDLICSYLDTKKQITAITDVLDQPKFEEMKLDVLKTHTRAFIKVQDGCENYCAYCAIPYSRGKIRSKNPDLVIDEINNLVKLGTKEVILAGINTGAYGKDLGNINLAGLINRIMTETPLYRLRLSSIELMEITDELLTTMKHYQNRIANHFHIPAQALSDGVLKRMQRKYDLHTYIEMINKIKSMFNNVAVTTDMLAGFVGETEDEFNEALENIKKISYAEMHIFPYSKREGTKAYSMEGHLDEKIKKERAKKMIALSLELKQQYINKFIGCDLEVIVETKKAGRYHAHSSNYLDITFESNEMLINKICLVHLDKVENGIIYGTLKEIKENE